MKLFGRNKPAEPLEIKQDIMRQIDGAIIAVGGGQRLFPHPGIEIRLFADDESLKSKYTGAFAENDLLQKAIHAHLQPPRCVSAQPFVRVSVEIKTPGAASQNNLEILFVEERKPAAVETKAYLEVLEGVANVKKMQLVHEKTYIGRCAETKQKGGKVSRINDLYFLDQREVTGKISKELKNSEVVNASVSRLHAHLEFDEKTGAYYLFDDGSTKGTTILHGGRGLGENVDRYAGKLLGDGDVINFGKAKARFLLVKKK